MSTALAPVVAPARPAIRYTDGHTRASRRLGSTELAQQLVSYAEEVMERCASIGVVPPPGWERLGEGVSRVALLGPDGCVYKIPVGWMYTHSNQAEADFYAMALAHRDYRPHVPYFRTLEIKVSHTLRGGLAGEPVMETVTVMVMERLTVSRERVRGDSTGGVDMVERMAAHIGTYDSHASNIGWRGQRPLLLDAGGGMSGHISSSDGCAQCNPRHYSLRKGK